MTPSLTLTDEVERSRVAELHAYAVLDTPAEHAFDDLTRLASQLCSVPMALVSLVDTDRQWFKSRVGLDVCDTERSVSFCAHALGAPELFVVPDATRDPLFSDNRLVTGSPNIRFYAGVPLVNSAGHTLGTLCVLDTRPRELTALQCEQLMSLGRQVMAQLELRRQAADLSAEVLARREAQIALEDAQVLLTGVLGAMGSLAYAKDLDGRFLMANHALTELLGRPLIGLTDHDLFPPAIADEYRRHDLEIIATSRRMLFEESLQHPDGSTHDYQSTKFPLLDRTGQVYALAGVSTDVTALAQAERRWHKLFDGSPVAIVVIDENDRIVDVNPEFCVLTGRSAADVLGWTGYELGQAMHTSANADPAVLIAASVDGISRTESSFQRPDGELRWALFTMTHITGPAGQPWTLAHLQDITERQSAEQAVLESEANLTSVARVVQQIQHGSDARQTIVDAAAELAHATYASLVEPHPDGNGLVITASVDGLLVGRRVPLDGSSLTAVVYATGRSEFVPDLTLHPLISPALSQLTDAKTMAFLPVCSGETVTAVLLVAWNHRLAGLADKRTAVLTLLADQTGLALRQAALLTELQQLALTDPLTELPNRRHWNELLAMQLAAADRTARPLTVALADLDHFKRYNDSQGHPAGDVLLREFAVISRRAVRAGDVVARWGGEEFAFALPNCAGAEAYGVLDRVREAVPQLQTCSIGYATWDGAESAEALLARADQALYAVKHEGRNRVAAAR